MQRLLYLLAAVVSAPATRIVTRSMIRGPTGVSPYFQRVALREPGTERPPPAVPVAERLEASLDHFPRSLLEEPDRLQKVELSFVEPTTTAMPLTTSPPEELSTLPAPTSPPVVNRTRLYPVARLWEERSETDLWSLLHAAYQCLFSGLHCFSDRVYPMFRSYLGLGGMYRPAGYQLLLPRSSHTTGEEKGEDEGRGLLRGRLVKELLLGLLLAHASLLPWLGGVGLASGKALLTGFLSLGAAGAVAAFENQPNYYM